MENLVIKGIISTTSNKPSKEFTAETTLKTAYLRLSEEEGAKLQSFGVTKYTSKDGDDFYCVKVVKNLKVYTGVAPNRQVTELETGIDNNNFKTAEGKTVALNIIKGNKANNDFYRLQAVLLTDLSDLEEIEAKDPFADLA